MSNEEININNDDSYRYGLNRDVLVKPYLKFESDLSKADARQIIIEVSMVLDLDSESAQSETNPEEFHLAESMIKIINRVQRYLSDGIISSESPWYEDLKKKLAEFSMYAADGQYKIDKT